MNKVKLKLILAVVIIFTLTSPILAKDFMWENSDTFRKSPAPHLVYPVTDAVKLTGDYLEFKWWNTERAIDRFEFRLYKGYNMYKSSLILKKILPFNTASLKVEANLFEDSQVYTWSLIQVGDNGEKSEKSFISFRIVKR